MNFMRANRFCTGSGPDVMIMDLKATTKEAAIDEMIAQLAAEPVAGAVAAAEEEPRRPAGLPHRAGGGPHRSVLGHF